MNRLEVLKANIDIEKAKLLFFSAVAGGSWVKLSLNLDLYNIILIISFVYGVIGSLKSLVELNKIKKELNNVKS
jgi:hypothetical protein